MWIPLWIFLSIGLGMGIILSVLFGIYNKNTNVYYVKNIFGMNSTNLITDAIIRSYFYLLYHS